MSLTLDGTLGLNSINIGANTPGTGAFTTLNTIGNVTLGDASGDTVTFNAATVTLNNSTVISAASTKTLTLNGGAGSNGLVIDASNNVGIGTGTPGSKLQVQGAATFVGSSATNNAEIRIQNTESGGATWRIGDGIATANGNLAVYRSNGSILATVLDSSGNLGLGVTPSTNSIAKTFEWQTGFNAFGYANIGYINANAYYNSGWIYKNTDAAGRYEVGGRHKWYTAASGTAGNAITFTQAMTLDANMCLGIGSGGTSPSSYAWFTSIASPITRPLGAFYSNAASDSSYPCIQIGKYANDSTTANIFIRFFYNNLYNGGGQINANGAGAAAFGSFSDSRLKGNIAALPNQLVNICALKPCEFDYKDGSGHQIGFIAQEMQEVYPDVIGENDDGMLTITGWSKTEARLVKAIQELSAELNELKARLPA